MSRACPVRRTPADFRFTESVSHSVEISDLRVSLDFRNVHLQSLSTHAFGMVAGRHSARHSSSASALSGVFMTLHVLILVLTGGTHDVTDGRAM